MELPGLVGVVAELEVDVVVGAGGAGAEGLGAVGVGEDVEGVAPAFDDCEGCVHGHPEDEVAHLAEAAAGGGSEASLVELHAGEVAFGFGGVAEGEPVGEGFAGLDGEAVEAFEGEFEVVDFVVLHPHVDVFEAAEEGGVVVEDEGWEGLGLFLSRELGT